MALAMIECVEERVSHEHFDFLVLVENLLIQRSSGCSRNTCRSLVLKWKPFQLEN